MGTTFYEAQRWHRRVGRVLGAASFVTVVVATLPVALVMSPPLAALALVATDVSSAVLPVPDLTADVRNVVEHAVDDGTDGDPPSEPLTGGQVATAAAVAVAPGLVVVVAAWAVVRRLFTVAGAEAVILAAEARPPDLTVLEERQLVNLVEELAIAGGIPPPRVRLVDRGMQNAAIVGRSARDATVVVPTGLLEAFGRRETSAIVALLVATAVNGDLRTAMSISAGAGSIGLLSGVVAAPTSRRARRALRALPAAVRDRGGDGGRRARFLLDELQALAEGDDLDDEAPAAPAGSLDREGLVLLATFPLLIARIALGMLDIVVVGIVATPALAVLWRRRRLRADATAVELTRDPDGLARALRRLQSRTGRVPAGPWGHLFVVGPDADEEHRRRRLDRDHTAATRSRRRRGETRRQAAARRHRGRRDAVHAYMGDSARSPGDERQGLDLDGFLPSIERRQERLRALGAGPDGGAREAERPWWAWPDVAWRLLGLSLAVPVGGALLAAALGIVVGLALMAAAVQVPFVAPVVLTVHDLVR